MREGEAGLGCCAVEEEEDVEVEDAGGPQT